MNKRQYSATETSTNLWTVTLNGRVLGQYRAPSKADALEEYAQDAGYDGVEGLLATVPGAVIA